jgi:23S rRNA (uridine2552-2'-O)-methyltransferase
MDRIAGSKFIQGDIQCPKVTLEIKEMHPKRFNVLISDMAHQFTGMRNIDVPKVEGLCEFALLIANVHLAKGGNFVCKFLQGGGSDQLVFRMAACFDNFYVDKPKSSRKESSEVFILLYDLALFYWYWV